MKDKGIYVEQYDFDVPKKLELSEPRMYAFLLFVGVTLSLSVFLLIQLLLPKYSTYIQRSQNPYKLQIDTAAMYYKLDPWLVEAVVEGSSQNDYTLINGKYVGLMQVRGSTNIVKNLDMGCSILSNLLTDHNIKDTLTIYQRGHYYNINNKLYGLYKKKIK